MYKREDLNRIIQNFVLSISGEYPVKELYLFGSYAQGNAREYSDIDIAVISDKFEGRRFWDKEKLAKYIIKAPAELEVHPFKTEDFTEDNPFVKEIMDTGIKIELPN